MDLQWLRNFIDIVDHQGLVAASRYNYLAPSLLSKHLKKIEKTLNKSLIARSSREFKLTEEGRCFYDYAKKILDLYKESETALNNQKKTIHGTIRLALPTPLIRLSLLNKLTDFLRRYPDVTLVLVKGNSLNVLLEHGADIVLTFSSTAKTKIIFKKILCLHRALLAAPAYLKKHMPIKSPQDLLQHNCLVNISACPDYQWHIKQQTILISGNISSVSTETLIPLAVQGTGIIYTYIELAEQELQSKKLQRVFSMKQDEAVPLYLAYSPLLASNACMALINFMLEQSNH